MAAFSTLYARVGYSLGYTLSTTTPVTLTEGKQFLNDGVDFIFAQFYGNKCWKLLQQHQKEVSYAMNGSSTSYDLYTILGNSTDYYGFINAQLGDFPVREVSIEEYYKIQNSGEYYPTCNNPYLCFFEYDTAEGHGNLPKVRVRPTSSTATLYFRYFIHPTAMSSDANTSGLGDICDNLLVLYAVAMGWMKMREPQMYVSTWQIFRDELDKLIAQYREDVYFGLNYSPTE